MSRTFALSAAVVAGLGGCQFLYNVDQGATAPDGGMTTDGSTPDGPAPFDRCTSFQGYDDPLRYAAVTSAPDVPLSWDAARAACVQRGMDLAVMNDAVELGAVDLDLAPWPMWLGQSRTSPTAAWTSVDGCPAVTPTDGSVVAAAAAAGGAACGLFVSANDVTSNACDGTVPAGSDSDGPTMVTFAMCETPRPESAACLHDPMKESYVASPGPLSHADAVAYCQGQQAHLVVIDSELELHHLSTLVPDLASADFWIGETWTGSGWQADTGCPGEFSWTDGGTQTQALDGATKCASSAVMQGNAGDDPAPLQLMGQQVTGCSELKLAVCETEE